MVEKSVRVRKATQNYVVAHMKNSKGLNESICQDILVDRIYSIGSSTGCEEEEEFTLTTSRFLTWGIQRLMVSFSEIRASRKKYIYGIKKNVHSK